MTITVAGIVLGIGVPSFMEFQRNNTMTAAANDLVTGILLARAETVKRQVPVTLCASPDPTVARPDCDGAGANGAFFVFVDDADPNVAAATDGNAALDDGETVLLRREAPRGTVQVWGDSDYITYAPSGFPRQAAGLATLPATRVLFCDDRGNRAAPGGSSARVVTIDVTGRGQVRQGIADVAAAVGLIGGAASCPAS